MAVTLYTLEEVMSMRRGRRFCQYYKGMQSSSWMEVSSAGILVWSNQDGQPVGMTLDIYNGSFYMDKEKGVTITAAQLEAAFDKVTREACSYEFIKWELLKELGL